ncbi:MAG: hypothetical protein Q9164_001692 [Protoblastenia rupestris]
MTPRGQAHKYANIHATLISYLLAASPAVLLRSIILLNTFQRYINATNSPQQTLYFAYGSNLWLQQTSLRCPFSTYIGVGRLDNFRWFINERGYANVAPMSNDSDSHVYGLIYTLTPSDEVALDRNEGVPDIYEKALLPVTLLASEDSGKNVDITQKGRVRNMLVYIDHDRKIELEPKDEYIYRMNAGAPAAYVEDVIRRFIPEVKKENVLVKNLARRQAVHFEGK